MDWIKEAIRLCGEANDQQARASDLANRLVEVRNRISTALGAPIDVAPGDVDELKVLNDRVAQAQSQSLAASGQVLTLLNSNLPPKK
jgi:hypothetical protein